jgi:hypothetical protein
MVYDPVYIYPVWLLSDVPRFQRATFQTHATANAENIKKILASLEDQLSDDVSPHFFIQISNDLV